MFQGILSRFFRSRPDNLRMASFEPNVATVKASFGMGCFWGVEALFGTTPGVIRTKCGYMGGTSTNPTYHNIADHTEAVELEYDPNAINYEKLLEIFWNNHDPTERQRKRQYMSAIFYHDDEQKKLAESTMKQVESNKNRPVATMLLPAKTFTDAEDYHQKYRLRGHTYMEDSLNLSNDQIKTSHIAARLNGWLSGYGSLEQFEKEKESMGLNAKQIEYMRRAIKTAVRHC